MRIKLRNVVLIIVALLIAGGLATTLIGRSPQAEAPGGSNATSISGAALALGERGTLHMVSPSYGWAVTEEKVLSTRNGGKTWNDVTPKEWGPPANTVGAFRGNRMTWLAGLKKDSSGLVIFRTRNGGKTWLSTKVGLPAPGEPAAPTSLAFPDEKHGWLLVSAGAGAGSNRVIVYKTADGGSSWKLVADAAAQSQQADRLPLGGIKTGLGALDDRSVWIAGLWYGDSTWLYATHDAGKTWRNELLTVPAGFTTAAGAVETRPPVFFKKSGVLPVLYRAENSIVFYMTQNGGLKWINTTPVKTSVTDPPVWSIVDSRRIFLTDGANLYTTSDGARTWKTTKPGTSLANATQLNFVNARIGWAVLGGKAYKTTNGGLTWAQAAK